MIPAWLTPLDRALEGVRAEDLSRWVPPPGAMLRDSAVLVLFGDDLPHGPDLLLIERAATLRTHSGQAAFPGGVVDPQDADAAAAALREAHEETGLDPSGVHVLRTLPALWLPVTGHAVTPVLGYWHRPSPVGVADPQEVAAVARVPLSDLAAAENRASVRHPSGYVGPAFLVADLLVWGFTAGVISRLLDLGGWNQPWDPRRIVDLED